MVTRCWKIHKYKLISLKMLARIYRNTPGNVLKLATVKNGTEFP